MNALSMLRMSVLALLALMLGGAAKEPAVGDIAPPFEVTLLDGTKVTRDELRGEVIVLNFWATWCAPCKRELPLLDGFYRLRKDAGLRVYAVTTEGSLPLSRLKPLFEKMNIPSARRIRGPYAPIRGAVPTNYVIDRAGRIRYAKASAFDLDELNTLLIPLLNEPRPQ